MSLRKLLELMAEKKASDMFLTVGSPIQIKINGMSVAINQNRLTDEQLVVSLKEVVHDKLWSQFEDQQELQLGHGVPGVGAFRLSLFKQRGTNAAVIRYIPADVPQFDTLNLPPVLKELILQKRGLILVVGATGSGKTTTLASLIDYRNEQRTGHILTLEDPIEFIFKNKRSIINQRQIGTDTKDLRTGLKNALRQAPDCILIGEIRDTETMGAALAYAQSGHLVLATLHANSASHAMNRILSFYTPETRRVLLSDLSSTLQAIISQRLLKSSTGSRIPAVEVLINTKHIANLIEQGDVSEIKHAMDNSMTPGSQTFEQALIELIHEGKVSKEEALANADSPTNLLWMLDNTTPKSKADKSSIGAQPQPGNGPGQAQAVPQAAAAARPAPPVSAQKPQGPRPAAIMGEQPETQPQTEATKFGDILLNI